MNVIKNVLSGNWTNLQKEIDKMAAQKVQTRINDKKVEVLAKMNNINKDEMIKIMADG